MSRDGMLVTVAMGILALGILYGFAGSNISERWGAWTIKALLAAGAAFAIGMLTLGLPGAFFLEAVLGPSPAIPPDAAWPLAIMITQIGAATIVPASLLLRLAMPAAVGWTHAGATALLTIVATLIVTVVLAGGATSA
jgi:hypothetical protein